MSRNCAAIRILVWLEAGRHAVYLGTHCAELLSLAVVDSGCHALEKLYRAFAAAFNPVGLSQCSHNKVTMRVALCVCVCHAFACMRRR